MKTAKWQFLFFLLCLCAPCARAAEPVATAWIINQSAATQQNAALARIQPEVHSVTQLEHYIEVRSAGVSLYDFGPLQTPAEHVERIRQLRFRLPRHPAPARGAQTSVRPDVLGVFLNGVPIYNQFTTLSYQRQNLWHFDPLARGDDGTFTAAGRPRAALTHSLNPGLLASLSAAASQHSPLLGYAFDGYPIYGPWGFANAAGRLQRLRSSYRLRQLKQRTQLPDGTPLTPAQYGPEVSADFPLGSFVEDYEFVAGIGELDEFNGRFAKTPEYPQGVYAYFLTTDAQGRLAFPYLLAARYYGQVTAEELVEAMRDAAAAEILPVKGASKEIRLSRLTFKAEGAQLIAGAPLRLSFQVQNAQGAPLRFLEYVHERPLHLLLVSGDLAEFAHIHPALAAGDRYEVTHTFPHAGRYRLYADFTPPGAAQQIVSLELTLSGKPRRPTPLRADASLTKAAHGLELRLRPQQPLRAGEDAALSFTICNAADGQTPADWQPYLGAWAHLVIIDQSKESFIHAHPLAAENAQRSAIETAHLHSVDAQSSRPPPAELRFLTNFPKPGLYKLWAQFQRGGQVFTQPFVVQVSAAIPQRPAAIPIPADAVKLTIGPRGFEPARLALPAARAVKLALTRATEPNCGQRIVFPALGLSRELPPGATVLLELPALPAGELRFSCGMGMYKGMIVVQ